MTFFLKNWRLFALIAAAGGVLWYFRHYGDVRAAAERQKVIAEDATATAKLRKQVAELTAEKLARAAAAKAHHDDEHAANLTAAAAPVGVSQLCKPAPDHRDIRVSEGSRAHAGDAATAAATSVVQPVPEADHGLADDRRRLLGALAGLADDQAAVIREFQAR